MNTKTRTAIQKIIVISLLLIAFVFCDLAQNQVLMANAEGQQYIEVTGDANIRTGAGKDYKSIGVAVEGSRLVYLNESQDDERPVTWHKVSFNGKEGWISSTLAQLMDENPQKSAGRGEIIQPLSSRQTVTITGGNANIRLEPNLDGGILGSVSEGRTMEYMGKVSTDGRGVDWYYINYNGKKGWVSSKYGKLSSASNASNNEMGVGTAEIGIGGAVNAINSSLIPIDVKEENTNQPNSMQNANSSLEGYKLPYNIEWGMAIGEVVDHLPSNDYNEWDDGSILTELVYDPQNATQGFPFESYESHHFYFRDNLDKSLLDEFGTYLADRFGGQGQTLAREDYVNVCSDLFPELVAEYGIESYTDIATHMFRVWDNEDTVIWGTSGLEEGDIELAQYTSAYIYSFDRKTVFGGYGDNGTGTSGSDNYNNLNNDDWLLQSIELSTVAYSIEELREQLGVFNPHELSHVTDVQETETGNGKKYFVTLEDDVFYGGSEGFNDEKEYLTKSGIMAERLADLDTDGQNELLLICMRCEDEKVYNQYQDLYYTEYAHNLYAMVFEIKDTKYVFADEIKLGGAFGSDCESRTCLVNGSYILCAHTAIMDGAVADLYAELFRYDGSKLFVERVGYASEEAETWTKE